MFKIGRRIYYDKLTGNLILDKGEIESINKPYSIEDDIKNYSLLSERNRETFEVFELPFGAYAQDFAACNGYRINTETKELEFSYPDPNAPEEPQPYQAPLSQVVAGQTEYLVDVDFRLSMIELGLV